MKPTNINRRDFIKKSGMLLAATFCTLVFTGWGETAYPLDQKPKNRNRQPMGRDCGRWRPRRLYRSYRRRP